MRKVKRKQCIYAANQRGICSQFRQLKEEPKDSSRIPPDIRSHQDTVEKSDCWHQQSGCSFLCHQEYKVLLPEVNILRDDSLLLEASCQETPLWEQAGTEYSNHTPYIEISKTFPILKNCYDEQKHTIVNILRTKCLL